MPDATSTSLTGVCSAYVLKLADVIRHLFGLELFARFAGTRIQAMISSPFYQQVDEAHGGALSALSSVPTSPGDGPIHSGCGFDATTPGVTPGVTGAPDLAPPPPDCQVDPDPSDEVMTGDCDTLSLLFGVFVDGVQLHQHGRATTTVIGIKCLDLPGFLSHTDLASYALAFIGGPKEPSNLSEIMAIVLKQFKLHEPMGYADEKGVATMTGENFASPCLAHVHCYGQSE